MTMIERRSALGDAAALAGPRLQIRDRGFAALALVAAWPGTGPDVAAALAPAGLDLPAAAGTVAEGPGGHAMMVAPGRWLLELAAPALPRLDAAIGTVTDIGHARCSFMLAGEDAPALAGKLAAVDLSLPRHGPGTVLQTGSAHSTPFTLWRQGPDRFVLYVERSYGRDFLDSLAAEAAEFGVA